MGVFHVLPINSHMLSHHPPLDALDRFRLGGLPDAHARAVSNHLLWCAECRQTVLDARELARLVAAVLERGAVAEYTAEPAFD